MRTEYAFGRVFEIEEDTDGTPHCEKCGAIPVITQGGIPACPECGGGNDIVKLMAQLLIEMRLIKKSIDEVQQ